MATRKKAEDIRVFVNEETLKRVIREAIHDEFAGIGLVADSASGALELQKDFSYLRTWRTIVQKGGMKILLTSVGLVFTGLVVAILLGLGVPAKIVAMLSGNFSFGS